MPFISRKKCSTDQPATSASVATQRRKVALINGIAAIPTSGLVRPPGFDEIVKHLRCPVGAAPSKVDLGVYFVPRKAPHRSKQKGHREELYDGYLFNAEILKKLNGHTPPPRHSNLAPSLAYQKNVPRIAISRKIVHQEPCRIAQRRSSITTQRKITNTGRQMARNLNDPAHGAKRPQRSLPVRMYKDCYRTLRPLSATARISASRPAGWRRRRGS